ncbi:MAG: N-acetylmuramoyl-L-alanine amidase, partial [Oscillospiraceae bacterium]|nr:N-acetylmuramoyl-L-alanine amidase [Oscillospiraceae bacterium]
MYSVRKKFRYSAEIAAFALIFVIILSLFNGDAVPAGSFGEDYGINLILDPGHGGEDGGATSPSGLRESEVNLDIALRTQLILAMFGVPVTMTRETEAIEYPAEATTIRAKKVADQRARLELVKSLDNAVLISIHQNYYGDKKPCGAETLYAPTEVSKEFALNMQ